MAATAFMPERLLARLWAKCQLSDDPAGIAHGCVDWNGAKSQSGWRGVWYPIFKVPDGRQGQVMRVNRLMILLYQPQTLLDVPYEASESPYDWLRRANRHYRGLESSHVCDRSLCVRVAHPGVAHPCRQRDVTDRAP